MLNDKTLQELKGKLESEKAQLEREIKELETVPDFGSDVTDFNEEEADQAEEYSNNLSMATDLKMRLAEVNSALSKIVNHGKYGVCEKCGKEIEIELLKVDPESRLCRGCKQSAQ